MSRLNLYSSAFWLFLSVYIAFECYRLGLGTWHEPGPGYFPFGATVLLGGMALSVFIKSLRRSAAPKQGPPLEQKSRRLNVVLVLIAMGLYSFFLNTIGFVLCTFLIVFFFVKVIALQRWKSSILMAIGMAVGSYLLFSVLLNAPLPLGFFRV
jgi:putative tricarboxylic transport membrane protein